MPNHITNRLKFSGEQNDIEYLLSSIKGEPFEDGTSRYIDFNKILPMPADLMIESGSLGEMVQALLFGEGRSLFLGLSELQSRFRAMDEKLQDEAIKNGLAYHRNIEKYGFSTWYDWSISNWGTKWNAYSQKLEDDVLWFDTAWSAPTDLMQKLSEQHPLVTIIHTYADEDSGSNTGIITYLGGAIIDCIQPESQSIGGYEIYFEINPDSRKEYEIVDGKYQYVEED